MMAVKMTKVRGFVLSSVMQIIIGPKRKAAINSAIKVRAVNVKKELDTMNTFSSLDLLLQRFYHRF